MKRASVVLLMAVTLVLGLACGATSHAQEAKAEDIAKMEAAMGSVKATATPAKPRKMLVFGLCQGFKHSAIPLGAKTFEMMGQKTGAFSVVVSDDISMFEPANLEQFDAVCMNNSTGELFLPKDVDKLPEAEKNAAIERDARLKQSLMDFVKGGKGIVGIHAATDAFYNWSDYGDMMGGYFDGHPWSEEVGIKIDDPASPINAAFKGQGFKVKDEIYQLKDPYSRRNLHILLSLDNANTNMDKGDKIHRADKDFAVAWIRTFSKGRVFYCSLGHYEEVFATPAILQHYCDGIQYAMGDLQADATPSAQANIDAAFAELKKYEFGQPRDFLTLVADAVRDSFPNPEARKAIEAKLIAVLESGDATQDAKQYACRQLWICGSDASLPALGKLLADEKTADFARYAMERMPAGKTDDVLIGAMAKAPGKAKIGIINSLGERRCAAAVEPMSKMLGDKDAATASAVICALGKIGGDAALKALDDAAAKASPEFQGVLADAQLACANQYRTDGAVDKAKAAYTAISAKELPKHYKIAATRGLVLCAGDGAPAMVVDLLKNADVDMQELGAKLAREAKAPGMAAALAGVLASVAPATQVLVLGALGDLGDPAVVKEVSAAVESQDAAVKTAALKALGRVGNAESALVIAKAVPTYSGREADAIRESIALVRGNDVDAAIVAAMPQADPAVRAELVKALAARNATANVADVMKAANDADEGVRVEAFKAIGILAGADQLGAVLDLLVTVQGDKARNEAEKACTSVAKKIAEEGKRAEAVIAKFEATGKGDKPTRASLLTVLGQIGDPAALDILRKAAKARNEEVSEAAIRAIAGWPTDAALDDCLDIAKNEDNQVLRIVSLRGAIRILGLGSGRPADATIGYYEKIIGMAETDEDKQAATTALAKFREEQAKKK